MTRATKITERGLLRSSRGHRLRLQLSRPAALAAGRTERPPGDAIYDRLHRNSDVGRAWIITANEEHAKHIVERFGARHVELQVGPEIQHQRRLQRQQGDVWGGFLQRQGVSNP